jgi:hypothetical protein
MCCSGVRLRLGRGRDLIDYLADYGILFAKVKHLYFAAPKADQLKL